MELITELSATDKVILDDEDIGIVEFYLPQCRACKSFSATYEALAQTNSDVHFYKMDATNNPTTNQNVSRLWNILAVPTLLIFEKEIVPETEIGRIEGNKSKEIIQTRIDSYKNTRIS